MKFIITDHGHLMKTRETANIKDLFLTKRCDAKYTERFGIIWPSNIPIKADLPGLPKEIWEMIAEYILYDYLRKGLIQYAIQILTLFSPSFTYKIYHHFFGSSYFSPASIIRERLSNVIFVAMGLQQEVLASDNNDCMPYFSIKLQFEDPYFYLPWELAEAGEPLFEFQINKMARPMDMKGHPHFYGFCCGETYGDTVWLQGNYDENCMFDATRILHPIINLHIPANHVFDWDQEYFRNLRPWTGFNQLLRLIFGADLGLFYAMSRPHLSSNPFNLLLREAAK